VSEPAPAPIAGDGAAGVDDTTTIEPSAAVDPSQDPRRWVTLGILITAVILIAVDTSVLNVSIPTILHELDTTVPSLEWVITGYSLTFATLLIIGGRLGDVYGHRRLFIIGAALFGTGSLLASESQSVGALVLGEAIIEGIGASLMTPATLAILSTTFRGRERATAFAVWGATIGAAVAFGPVLGGFLTTNYSWRWSFRINVIVAPLAVLGALAFMPSRVGERHKVPIDVPGAAMIASGMFLLVFAISQGGSYGWWQQTEPFAIGSIEPWPASMPFSVIPLAVVGAVVILTSFVLYERAKERRGGNPLFELSMLRFRSFRFGLLTVGVLSMGQLGLLFALPLFLQEARHLSALVNGLWMLPMGIAVIIGSQVGGRLTRRISVTGVVQVGLLVEVVGLICVLLAIGPDITFWSLVPGLCIFGVGIGFATSQVTGVVLYDIPADKAGVAGGTNSTARQVGAALGAAVIGSVVTVQTTNRVLAALADTSLTGALRAQVTAGVQAFGPSYTPPPTMHPTDVATVSSLLTDALASSTRLAILFALTVVALGGLASLLIPRIHLEDTPAARSLDTFEAVNPESVDPAEVEREIERELASDPVATVVGGSRPPGEPAGVDAASADSHPVAD
jgi:EmrB/QacA subfamily drug resistance transporter